MIYGPVIQTASGLYVNPLDFHKHDVRLEDIAHALSHQCRFGGSTRVFYSVAEHSVRVAGLIGDEYPNDFELQLRAVLHDGSETYLCDLPHPLKAHSKLGALYREIEAPVQAAVYSAFGLDNETPECIKDADFRLGATERRDLMPDDGEEWEAQAGYAPLDEHIVPLSYLRARRLFTSCVLVLVSQMKQAQNVSAPEAPPDPHTDHGSDLGS